MKYLRIFWRSYVAALRVAGRLALVLICVTLGVVVGVLIVGGH